MDFGSVAGRFISAHAENTFGARQPPARRPVHLRARGEHFSARNKWPLFAGSSPRTRRTHGLHIFNASRFRFISAHAENTRRADESAPSAAVHLRARGEHNRPQLGLGIKIGSSPRTRRTLQYLDFAGWRCRFISAHAENTPDDSSKATISAVHLRARGEHALTSTSPGSSSGSSPRTRRTRHARCDAPHRSRFISAHAENTLLWVAYRPHNPVHLRARGEHPALAIRHVVAFGSSPRTRRTLPTAPLPNRHGRFISAHAENTGTQSARSWRRGGSSPRTRRTPEMYLGDTDTTRFISAHAENT